MFATESEKAIYEMLQGNPDMIYANYFKSHCYALGAEGILLKIANFPECLKAGQLRENTQELLVA